jgi:hypothetical protein
MAALTKLCLFTHTKLFIMFLFATHFTFIFPFESQQCCAWIVFETNNMSYSTLLKLLDVYKWILVFILFLTIDTCCVKGWKTTHRIFAWKEDRFTFYIVFISHVIFGFVLLFSSCCSFPACCLGFFFFLFLWTFICNNPLV